jgi:dolichol-phosphate mannosyltransferase
MAPLISYLIPAYNEEKNLHETVEEIMGLQKLFPSFEIVIVNDGSSDNTDIVSKELSDTYKFIRTVNHKKNEGFGAAYRTAFENATGKFCILVPGDNAHPGQTLIPILERAGTADIIIPFTSNPEARTYFRQKTSSLFVFIINSTMGLNIKYYNGLVLHNTELLKMVKPQTSGYAYQAEILVKLVKAGASYVEVGTRISERSSGETKAFKFRNVIRVVASLLHLIRIFWGAERVESKELRSYINKNR